MKIEELECVKIKRGGQEKLHEKTKLMTNQEKIQFYRRSADQLLDRQVELQKREAGGSQTGVVARAG